MSTGANCMIYEKAPRAWYYDLQQYPYGETDKYTTEGPFPTFRAAEKHLDDHHANPGGYSVSPLPNCPHDLKRALTRHEFDRGLAEYCCDRCGTAWRDVPMFAFGIEHVTKLVEPGSDLATAPATGWVVDHSAPTDDSRIMRRQSAYQETPAGTVQIGRGVR